MLIVVGMAWMYVVLLMAVVEASAADGTLLGAGITFLMYGVLPLAIVLYILGTPARRAAARRRASAADPDHPDHPPGDAVAAEREEP
jgi:hypothetical protein